MLNLIFSYTVITAKQDGFVSKVPVQVGQFYKLEHNYLALS